MNRFKLLAAAIIDGNLPLVKKFFNVNCIDPESGAPLLFTAIRFHRDAITDFLFTQHMATESLSSLRDFKGNTALTIAIEYKNTVAQVFPTLNGKEPTGFSRCRLDLCPKQCQGIPDILGS